MTRNRTVTAAAVVAISSGALVGCVSLDCMYDSSGYMIDPAGCAAGQVDKSIMAWHVERAEAEAKRGTSYTKYSLGSKYEEGGMVLLHEPDGRWRGESFEIGKNRRRAVYWYKQAVLQGGSGAERARAALLKLGKKPPETPASSPAAPR